MQCYFTAPQPTSGKLSVKKLENNTKLLLIMFIDLIKLPYTGCQFYENSVYISFIRTNF